MRSLKVVGLAVVLFGIVALASGCPQNSSSSGSKEGELQAKPLEMLTRFDDSSVYNLKVFCDAPRGNLVYFARNAMVVVHQPESCGEGESAK